MISDHDHPEPDFAYLLFSLTEKNKYLLIALLILTHQRPERSYIDTLLQTVNSYMGISKRSIDADFDLEAEVSLIAMMYIRLYTDLVSIPDSDFNGQNVDNEINKLHNALSSRGKIQEKVSSVIKNKLISIL